MFIFKIGHGAYKGKNELAFCFAVSFGFALNTLSIGISFNPCLISSLVIILRPFAIAHDMVII